jgi:hypothetical protein
MNEGEGIHPVMIKTASGIDQHSLVCGNKLISNVILIICGLKGFKK